MGADVTIALDKKALHKEIDRDARKRERETLARLRADAKGVCAKGRADARDLRAQKIEEAKDLGRAAREVARSACAASRAPLEDERAHAAAMRRIARANKERKPGVASARVQRLESDDEVRQNIPSELVPLFERVKRQIRGSSRMSRTEAFLKYVEEHPREQFDAVDDATDRLIAELEVRQRRANPGSLVELGVMTECDYLDRAGRRRVLRWGLRSAPRLIYDASGKLLVVYGARAVASATAGDVRAYAKTHWGERGRGELAEGIVAHAPFERLGVGVSVTYTTRKGSNELVDWVHAWGEGGSRGWIAPVVLRHVCQNPRCSANGTISFAGGTYRVTARGIVG